MIRWLIIGALLLWAAAYVLGHATAHDQSFCSDILSARQRLQEAGERPIVSYLDGEIVKVIFGNTETGSWTLVGVDTGGNACTMRNGMGLIVS